MNRGFHLPVIQSQDSVSKGENSGIMSNNNDGPPQTSAKICFIVVYEEAGFLHQTQTETALNVDSTSEKMTPATPVKSLLRFDSSVLIAKEIIYRRPAELRGVFSGSISERILVDRRKSRKTDHFVSKTQRFSTFPLAYAGDT